MTHKGWYVVKPQHNTFKVLFEIALLDSLEYLQQIFCQEIKNNQYCWLNKVHVSYLKSCHAE